MLVFVKVESIPVKEIVEVFKKFVSCKCNLIYSG